MERDRSFAEHDPIAIAQSCRPIDAPIVQQEHVTGAGGQVDQNEFAIGRPLDECVMPMHRRMIERDVIVAVPPDAQHFAGEQDRRQRPIFNASTTGRNLNPRLVTDASTITGQRGSTNNVDFATPPHRAAECDDARQQRQQAGNREADHEDGRSTVGIDNLRAGSPSELDHALVHRLHRELEHFLGSTGAGCLADGRNDHYQ